MILRSKEIACDEISLKLSSLVRNIDPYQTFTFISDSIAKSHFFSKTSLFYEYPSNLYLVNVHHPKFYYDFSLTNIQSSLIIFYTCEYPEIAWFSRFLQFILEYNIPLFRERPKCLVIYLNDFKNARQINPFPMKYAWQIKFLDFTIIATNNIDSSSTVHYFNPFNDIIYQKELVENVEVFPEKLKYAYEYPIHIADFSPDLMTWQIRQPNRKAKVIYLGDFMTYFVAETLNLKIINIKLDYPTTFKDEYLIDHKLDMLPNLVTSGGFFKNIQIPADGNSQNPVAVVLIA